MPKACVGVMGSAGPGSASDPRIVALAEKLGEVVAARNLVLITGATTGLPDLVSRSARKSGGFTIGISPAANQNEHTSVYGLPADASDVVIYTGFGLKGRNVLNIRSSDVVIIIGGGMGTLNEFTIAFDEGRIIGVLEGSGGIADHVDEIIKFAGRPGRSRVLIESDPAALVDMCLNALTGY